MANCEMKPECTRNATYKLIIEYPHGKTSKRYLCKKHTKELKDEIHLNKNRITEIKLFPGSIGDP